MNGLPSMTRTLLAALGIIIAAASSALASEDIARKATAPGGEEVMEEKTRWRETAAFRPDLTLLQGTHASPCLLAGGAGHTTLFLSRCPFESALSRLERKRQAQGAFSFLKTVPALHSAVEDVEELRLPRIAVPDHGITAFLMPNYMAYVVAPIEQFIDPNDSRVAYRDLNLPCFATDYDKTVNRLRMTYFLWEEYARVLLAQTLQEPEDLAIFAGTRPEMARTNP